MVTCGLIVRSGFGALLSLGQARPMLGVDLVQGFVGIGVLEWESNR